MDLVHYVVLIILLRKTKVGTFTVSDFETDWLTASKNCTLATPELIASSGITKDQIHGITEDVWVGYYQATAALEYFGCAKKNSNTPGIRTKADPGICMSVCGPRKTIGIFENECVCFDNDQTNDETMMQYCNNACKNRGGIVCGGTDATNTTYMSLYRSIDTDIVFGDGGGKKNCLYYDTSVFTWDNCSLGHLTLCEKDNAVWIENTVTESNWTNWITSTIRCFVNKTRPPTYYNTPKIENSSSSDFWTGVVRSQVIYKLTDDHRHLNNANMYGYLNKQTALKFGIVKTQRKFLCVNERRSDEDINGGSSDVGAIVGATLSIVVVIVVIIVVVLFIRKRGIKLPFFQKVKQTQNTNNVQNNIGYVITRPVEILQSTYHSDQDEYADIDLTTTIDNEANIGASNDATECSYYAHDYFVLEKVEEETYDSTKPDDQTSDPNTFNPYNKLSFEESSNYDHIGAGAGNAGRKVADSENTYNTTSLGNSYAKTGDGVPSNAYNMTEDPADAYNHTDIPMHQMGLRASETGYDAI